MPLTSLNLYTLKQIRLTHRHYNLGSCSITCPLACYKVLQTFLDLSSEPVEKFGIISLNAKRKINGIHIIGVGSLDQVNVEPREVFAAALMNNAAAIIAFHNHPSGDPVPSPADFAITRRLQEAGEIMNIRVLDHLVIGEGRFYSMREGGSL